MQGWAGKGGGGLGLSDLSCLCPFSWSPPSDDPGLSQMHPTPAELASPPGHPELSQNYPFLYRKRRRSQAQVLLGARQDQSLPSPPTPPAIFEFQYKSDQPDYQQLLWKDYARLPRCPMHLAKRQIGSRCAKRHGADVLTRAGNLWHHWI